VLLESISTVSSRLLGFCLINIRVTMFTAPIILMRVVARTSLIHDSVFPLLAVAARQGGSRRANHVEEEVARSAPFTEGA
jgi:hypothetical protein